MTVYPIELSQQLKELLDKQQLNLALTFDNESLELTWLKAIAHQEGGDSTSAIASFENILSANQNLEDFKDPLKLSAQIELIILQPIKYSNNSELIKLLRMQINKLPEHRLLARLLHALAIVMQWRRNTPQAIKYLLHAQDIYRTISENHGLAMILDTLGNVTSSIADHQQALLYYSESLALKTMLDDYRGQAMTLGNLSRLCLQLGRYRQAKNFVELDIALSEKEPPETKARLLNLLARIEITSENWNEARTHLNQAIALIKDKSSDSLFFCSKDLALLNIKQNKTESIKETLDQLNKLLPKNSPYHQVQLELVENRYAEINNKLSLIDAEKLLAKIEQLDIPELEIEYRIKVSQLAAKNHQSKTSQQHLLLSRKMAKKNGFKRFFPEINSLMVNLEIKENIDEETIRVISDDISQVDDGYLIRKKLGSGGFGDVYLAHDMSYGRDVAIKRFHSADFLDHREQKKLWDQARLEFEAVATITHPSIAKIYAIGHDSRGNPYLVQEFIRGGDLRQKMHLSNDLNTALTYLLPIVRALAAVHDTGTVHRDIKPENILVNQQGVSVLVDFGIALLRQKSHHKERIQGTEHYIAPEQKISTAIDFRADLFSLGCVLYEWLSGKKIKIKPHKTSKLSSWLGIKKTADVSVIDKKICGKAYELISSLLSFEPENRPESASLVADRMQELLVRNTE